VALVKADGSHFFRRVLLIKEKFKFLYMENVLIK